MVGGEKAARSGGSMDFSTPTYRALIECSQMPIRRSWTACSASGDREEVRAGSRYRGCEVASCAFELSVQYERGLRPTVVIAPVACHRIALSA